MKTTYRKNRGVRAAQNLSTTLIALSLIFIISTGTAAAFSTYEGLYSDPVTEIGDAVSNNPYTLNEPSSTATDECLPLLKTIRHTPPKFVAERNQRSAGKAAALGLVFGVRFALSPTDKVNPNRRNTAQLGVWTPSGKTLTGDNRSALAVSAYRQCQKDQALKALNDFRWSR